MSHFEEIAQASDQDLVSACTAVAWCFVIPMRDEDVQAVHEIVMAWDETAVMTPESRATLIAILHRLLSPAAN